MSQFRLRRLAAALSAVALVSFMVTTVPAAAKSGHPVLTAKPSMALANNQAIHVRGGGFTPGDTLTLIECQRTATNPTGCDPATATPVTVNAKGHIGKVTFTVVTGVVGAGTCGTSKTDKYACEITADDLSTASQFVASVKIGLLPNPLPVPGGLTRRE